MRRLLSVAPVLLWLVTPSPSRNCRVSPASRCLAVDKLVAPGADAGVHYLVDVYSGILLMMTSFTRIIIVFGLLRKHWEHPPRHLTRYCWGWHCFYLFYYVAGDRQNLCRCVPAISEEKISMQEALEKGAQPLRDLCCVRPVRRI